MARGKVLQEDDEIETLPSEAKRGESVTADLPKTGTPRTPSLSQKRSKQKGSDLGFWLFFFKATLEHQEGRKKT